MSLFEQAEEGHISRLHLEEPSNWDQPYCNTIIGLQMHTLKDADPELGHSLMCLNCVSKLESLAYREDIEGIQS